MTEPSPQRWRWWARLRCPHASPASWRKSVVVDFFGRSAREDRNRFELGPVGDGEKRVRVRPMVTRGDADEDIQRALDILYQLEDDPALCPDASDIYVERLRPGVSGCASRPRPNGPLKVCSAARVRSTCSRCRS